MSCPRLSTIIFSTDRSTSAHSAGLSSTKRIPIPGSVPAGAAAGTGFATLQAVGALPSCYKYRVFETIVPLRNMIWR